MSKNGKRWVTAYESCQCYGGPEEGGWYYWVVEAQQSWKFSTNRSARAFKDKMSKLYERHNKNNYVDRTHFAIENKRELGIQDSTKKPRPHYE